MTNYEKFVNFMNDLEVNKKDLTAKLADAQDKIELFDRELNSAKSKCIAVDGKIEELTNKLKECPTSVGLSAEFGIWQVRKSDFGASVDTYKYALDNAKKVYEALILQHKDLDYGPLAELATMEMNLHVKDLYKELCEGIGFAIEARQVYLEAISQLNKIRNAGKNAVEAGQKSASYAKINKIENSADHFSVNSRQFIVTEGEVIKA